jgi:hypothetical protein
MSFFYQSGGMYFFFLKVNFKLTQHTKEFKVIMVRHNDVGLNMQFINLFLFYILYFYIFLKFQNFLVLAIFPCFK